MTGTAIPDKASERAKYFAAKEALKNIKTGMKVGLGTGSTAYWFVELLADRIAAEGMEILAVPTSSQTRDQALSRGIKLATLEEVGSLDVVVDGADEATARLDLIKGGGGALLQEKIVASASQSMIVIMDETKYVDPLGAFPLPVEIVRFGAGATARGVARVLVECGLNGVEMTWRKAAEGTNFVTDEGHYILDLHCHSIHDPDTLEAKLNQLPGVVDNGLFIGLASRLIIGRADGHARVITADNARGQIVAV